MVLGVVCVALPFLPSISCSYPSSAVRLRLDDLNQSRHSLSPDRSAYGSTLRNPGIMLTRNQVVPSDPSVHPLYRGTSLIRNTPLLGPYSRTIPCNGLSHATSRAVSDPFDTKRGLTLGEIEVHLFLVENNMATIHSPPWTKKSFTVLILLECSREPSRWPSCFFWRVSPSDPTVH